MSNLKLDIANFVRLFYPKTITYALNLAKQVEAMVYHVPRKPFIHHKPGPITPTSSSYSPQIATKQHTPSINTPYYNKQLPPLLPTPKTPINPYYNTSRPNTYNFPKPQVTKPETQKVNPSPTREEKEERRRKGLCVWCGVKFTFGHKCVRSQLYQLLMEDMDDKEGEVEEFVDCRENIKELGATKEDTGALHTISLHALVGTEGHQTMRMTGKIKNQLLMILVDSRSTHNFLDQSIAKRLACTFQRIKGFKVTVANGDILETQKLCKHVQWEVQD